MHQTSPLIIVEMLEVLRRRAASVSASALPTERASDLWGEAADAMADAIRLMRQAITDTTPDASAYDLWLDSVRQRQDAARKSA